MRAVLIAVFSVALLSAQVDTGAVSGIVRDPTGAVVPDATINIVQRETNIGTELATNGSGFYAAQPCDPAATRSP
jgi:hypothetical protein